MAKPGWLVLSRSGFCTYGTHHMETVQALYFCFGAKPANSNFATKTAKKKMWVLSFFIAKLPEKAKKIEILLRFQRWMTKTNILRARSILSWTSGNFWCRNWNRNRRKPGGQRRFYQPTEKCKHRRLLIWTLALLRYIEVNGIMRPSLTTFCRNLLKRTEEKRRRLRTGYSFQFSVQCKLTVILRRNIHLTYPRTMSWKNPDKSL